MWQRRAGVFPKVFGNFINGRSNDFQPETGRRFVALQPRVSLASFRKTTTEINSTLATRKSEKVGVLSFIERH